MAAAKAAAAAALSLLLQLPGLAEASSLFELQHAGRKPNPFMAHNNAGCPGWNSHYWPQVSFWAQQVWRRQLTVDPADAEAVAQMTNFSHQAAFFTCVVGMDPRDGTTWSEATAEYFKQVDAADGLIMPPPSSESFVGRSNISAVGLSAEGQCMWWSEVMMCDLGWWSLVVKGNKDYGGGLCWDKVQHPGYQWTGNGYLAQTIMPHHMPPGTNQLYHPEYTECLQYNINSTMIDALCPLGGYMPDGMYGVPHWGDGVPLGEPRELVEQCQAKVGFARLKFITDAERSRVYTPADHYIGLW